eukprot:TRINITY_DN14756_c0_g1_i1.p1 TRINITY_DN14756_c0_g1~~TRINITY_DN14756_c0_g1_i1.p1  ORF type:complete len:341 (+),score=48.53 TRINITY_DN14756_c0_g1_i1:43-1065(+)
MLPRLLFPLSLFGSAIAVFTNGDIHGTLAESDDVSSFRLLVVQRSRYINLETRLKTNLETWIPLLSKQDKLLTFVSAHGKKSNETVIPKALGLVAVDCADEHGLLCTAAEYQRIALPMMKKYDAMYVIDDDTYLHPSNLKKTLKQMFKDEGVNGTAFGVIGCGVPYPPPATVSGWCGGAGFGFSRASAIKLMQTPIHGPAMDAGGPDKKNGHMRVHTGKKSPADGFVNAFLEEKQYAVQVAKGSEVTEDVVVGSSWKKQGVPLQTLKGAHGWRLTEEKLQTALHSCEPSPVFFHRMTEQMKTHIHESLRNVPVCGFSLAQTLQPSYLDQLDAFVASNGKL